VALTLIIFCLLQLHGRGLLPTQASTGPNLVLVGVDTLRADHMGCYGYYRDTTPNIDRWASGAVIFDQCTVSTPRTTQSLASILTARYPKDIGVRYLSDRLPREQLSLAEILKNQGYTTVAVIATGVPHGKLEDGFDVVLDTESEWTASETLGKALEQLALVKGKYFLFVFFRDPHMPYRPSEAVYTSPDYKGRFSRDVSFVPDKQNCVFRNDFTPGEREQAVALYDSEIRDIDRAFGRLLEEVKKKDGETLTAFFSDHGESLGEHDYYYDHGDLLYQPGLRVPLIIEGIPFPAPRITRQVRSIDLAPSLLAGLGLDPEQYPFQGVDLQIHETPLPAFSESGHAMIRTAYTTGRRQIHGLRGRLRSLTMDNRKLICIPTHQGFEFEYYDLLADREEVIGLAKSGPRYQEMTERLLHWVEEDRRNWTGAVKVYDEQTRQRLESLGYLDRR
jgi:arylsulfatase A-like enzyme